MPKSKTNGNGSGNGADPVVVRDVQAFYTAPVEGAGTIAEMFAPANNAMAIGHRTYSNVPFDKICKAGDVMTAAQADFLSAQIVRNSLGNEDYDTIDKAAATPMRAIPTQYSLLEDAADNIVQRLFERQNAPTGRRVDREGQVARFLAAKSGTKLKGSDTLLATEIANELASLIAARKAVKGKAAETAKVEAGDFLDEE